MILKEELLKIELVVDNEYLDKYCELINLHLNDKKEKYKTQGHHIIPQYYYVDNNLKINSKKENIVNLSHKDHALAHYYLCLCSKDKYVYKNECALEYIFGHNLKEMNKDEIIKELDKYQEVFKDYCKRDTKCFERKGIPVVQYDKYTLNFIAEFSTSEEASRKTGVSVSGIRNCKNEKQHTAGGYIWAEKGKNPVHLSERKINIETKHVIQYDKDTLLEIKEWNSVKEIAKEFKASQKSIRRCCLEKDKTYKGYIWRYKDDNVPLIIEKEPKKRKRKNVYMYNLEGQLINTFDSSFDASECLDLFEDSIRKCCNGSTLSYHNFIFLYKKDIGIVNDRKNRIKNRIKNMKKINSKKVFQYDLGCNLIQVFNSIKEASDKTFISASCIRKNCYKKTKKGKGYFWRFEGDVPTPIIKKQKLIPKKKIKLIAYNKTTGEKVGEWHKYCDAVKETGKSYSRIKNCVCGLSSCVDEYIFKIQKNVG